MWLSRLFLCSRSSPFHLPYHLHPSRMPRTVQAHLCSGAEGDGGQKNNESRRRTSGGRSWWSTGRARSCRCRGRSSALAAALHRVRRLPSLPRREQPHRPDPLDLDRPLPHPSR
ncbi:hypothetical protein VPH35_053264 [Triticum aestivum]